MNATNLILYGFEEQSPAMLLQLSQLSPMPEAGRCYALFVRKLTDMAETCGFSGNLWHCYLTWHIACHENVYSRACEGTGKTESSIRSLAAADFEHFMRWMNFRFEEIDSKCEAGYAGILNDYQCCGNTRKMYGRKIRERICRLAEELAKAETTEDFQSLVEEFYREWGVGKYGLHKAFRLEGDEEDTRVVPITNIASVDLDDLVGYEEAKKKLIENTEAFVEGRSANNCLLFGDAGTGKSSSIKGIINRYHDRGLRIIEIYKHQFRQLNALIDQIKNRNYKFIIYMDDLSFEEFETEYKYLKAVIEGGLEKKPDNILIYATSNRRHLIRENYADKFRDGEEIRQDMHTSDTVQEKLSLVYRFGVTIYFGSPNQKEYLHIVEVLSERAGLKKDREELFAEAKKWELYHGGLSGRTAQQFIDYVSGIEG